MRTKNHIATLGSLFDGIGGFPYAAVFFGIQPLWASEILPQAVSVTRRHLPEMKHFGDITMLRGDELPPVDIITFGSPCQDLSVAGKRAGLNGERSGLFAEAIRIIDEMRIATDGIYPRYAVWENVPGALSSGKPAGSDFQAVLESFAKTKIPMPISGKWANAGMVRGFGASVAWCVYNAQYFGVPQRRRRIFLVCDFGGGCAGEILFVPKSLFGYFTARGAQGQRFASDAERGAGGASANCLTPWDAQQTRVFTEDGLSPTLAGADGGGGRNPAGLVFTTLGVHQNGNGEVNTATEAAYTLNTNGNATRRNAPVVAHPAICGTLVASGAGLSRTAGLASETELCVVVPDGGVIPIQDKATRYIGGGAGNGLGVGKPGDPAPTVTAGDRHAVAAYALQGNMIGRMEHNGPRGDGVKENISFALTATDTPAVAAVDCRNCTEIGDISGTLQAKDKPGYSLHFQNPVRAGYIVRRLTPTECERLQGYPDGWTRYEQNGKEISDSRRYQMLGNSVAVPCVAYILLGIAERMDPDYNPVDSRESATVYGGEEAA
ncbi:MAG: DNA cytosine methyltransferase [Oscillospiraceae bacterium]|nr:DNA cytosine methyltransferase [Oscillospiraceae bacterium]